ncbi:iron chelate uptake ABC transporter family permease subunit [uncultured Cohaesibacter sp.]|uniref:iron chelate uptake ABC transporter family permease subunit n=1 Tax=uncultured Cohaesibacter sp. TaxID=1002546 RepID=UPI0029C8BEFC|nr:iron chelate uptake ABC transporter family permease subunit [uncultured Cohaesibacter sp.]
MSRTTLAFVLIVSVLFMALLANLSIGAAAIAPRDVVSTLLQFDENNYDHFIVLYQRVPRALMAIFIGAVMACSGAVLQGITRNPLASPALLGINAGATLFVVAGSVFFSLPEGLQAPAAIAGGLFGFSGCLMVARMIGFQP